MYYFLPLIVSAILLPVLLHTFTTLTARQRRFVYVVCSILVLLAGVYEFFKETASNTNRAKVLAFTQGRTLKCQMRIVHQAQFNLVSGTLTFVAKPKSPYVGESYQVNECSVITE
jgi:chromate transport protein ChrA